jgi:hypothetical protein
MSGFTPFNNELLARELATGCEELVAQGVPVPESLALLDILGPRHASWGAREKAVKGRRVLLRAGEALLSITLLANIYGWTESTARRFLQRQLKDDFLVWVRDEGNAGTVYRVQHFAQYRSGEELPEHLLLPRPAMRRQSLATVKVVGTSMLDKPFEDAYAEQLCLDDYAAEVLQRGGSTVGAADETLLSRASDLSDQLRSASLKSASDFDEVCSWDLPALSEEVLALLENDRMPRMVNGEAVERFDDRNTYLAELRRLYPGPIRVGKDDDLELRWFALFSDSGYWRPRLNDIFSGLARYRRYCDALPRHTLPLDIWVECELYTLDWFLEDQWIENLPRNERFEAHSRQQQLRRTAALVRDAEAMQTARFLGA